MNRLTEHLIVVSFDCLSSLDYPLLQELPHFRRLLDEGALCRNVRTIYPSVTYPCHASIVTGNYPKRHGIINNTLIQPGRPSSDWYWHRSHIRGTTLYDEAKAAGLTTAALLWPVTAKANIDYNLPEIFANRPWHHQIMVSLMNGTPLYQMDLQRRFGSIRNGLEQPALDDFVLESAVHTIRTKKPGLTLIHFTDLDTMRHYHGFSSKEAVDAIHRHDDRLGRIMHALDESGCEYTLVALGDHSALDEETAIQLNVCFKQKGWITCDRKGKVTDWQVYAKGCDGSSYVYVRDDRLMDEVHQLLKALQKKKKELKPSSRDMKPGSWVQTEVLHSCSRQREAITSRTSPRATFFIAFHRKMSRIAPIHGVLMGTPLLKSSTGRYSWPWAKESERRKSP